VIKLKIGLAYFKNIDFEVVNFKVTAELVKVIEAEASYFHKQFL
jgi:hypothetical protein